MPDQALSFEQSTQLFKEQQAASVMQLRMLPAQHSTFGAITINYELFRASSLSGDFVDVVELADGRVVFLVADVAGHGAGAALVTVAVKSFMSRLSATSVLSAADSLQALNAELLGVNLDRHVCALAGIVDPQTYQLQLASAGAFPAPLFWSATSTTENTATSLELVGKALALFDDPHYKNETIALGVGDRLTVVTDGVLELLKGDTLAVQEQRLTVAAAAPTQEFWQVLGVEPAEGGVDDVTRFTLERQE